MTSPLPASDKLARRLAELESRLKRLEAGRSASQLSHSSVDDGTLLVKDDTGTVRQRIGKQPDGSYGNVDENGPPPPKPTGPTVESFGEAVRVIWDGAFAGGAERPRDFRYIEVRAGTSPTFSESSKRMVILDTDNDGGEVVLSTADDLYIWFVAVSTSGTRSEPSDAAFGEPGDLVGGVGPGDITEVEIADDAITAPKIRAAAVEAGKIAANAIDAGNIQAGAITAAKLAAEIILSSKLTAGNPAGARLELSDSGLEQFDSLNQPIARLGPAGEGEENQFTVKSSTDSSSVQLGPGSKINATAEIGTEIELTADYDGDPAIVMWSEDGTSDSFIRPGQGSVSDKSWLHIAGNERPDPAGNLRPILFLHDDSVFATLCDYNTKETFYGQIYATAETAGMSYKDVNGSTVSRIFVDNPAAVIGSMENGVFRSRVSSEGETAYIASYTANGTARNWVTSDPNTSGIYVRPNPDSSTATSSFEVWANGYIKLHSIQDSQISFDQTDGEVWFYNGDRKGFFLNIPYGIISRQENGSHTNWTHFQGNDLPSNVSGVSNHSQAGYYMDATGTVHLAGNLNVNSNHNGTTLWTMPEELWPWSDLRIPIMANRLSASQGTPRVVIRGQNTAGAAPGQVQLFGLPTSGSVSVSLDGIQYICNPRPGRWL